MSDDMLIMIMAAAIAVPHALATMMSHWQHFKEQHDRMSNKREKCKESLKKMLDDA